MSDSTIKTWVKNNFADKEWLWSGLKSAQGLKYQLDYQYYYSGIFTKKASTREVNLEFCNSCNLRCKFCALDHLKPKAYMSIEVLDKVFNDLLNDSRFTNVKTINLYNGGETLLHPKRMELFSRIKLHKALWLQQGKKFPKIVLLTNGMLLREKLARELLELNVLDEVGFSLDGGSEEAFEELRVNAKWEKFANNLQTFVNLKNIISPEVKTFGISIVEKPNPLNSSWMSPVFCGRSLHHRSQTA